jgi:hypothetical protein
MKKRKTLNEMFETLNGINPNIPETSVNNNSKIANHLSVKLNGSMKDYIAILSSIKSHIDPQVATQIDNSIKQLIAIDQQVQGLISNSSSNKPSF